MSILAFGALRVDSTEPVDLDTVKEAFTQGVLVQREAWRTWYDALPADLRAAIDEHMAHERQRRAFQQAVAS